MNGTERRTQHQKIKFICFCFCFVLFCFIFGEDPVMWAQSGHSPPFLRPHSRPHETTFSQIVSPYTEKARDPLLWADRHINTMLPLSAASMRSGENRSQAHADASPLGGREKRQQYLSHLWLSFFFFFFFFFFQDGEQCCLYGVVLSLSRPQPRMVAVLWWPLHKSVLVLSLGNVARQELR